MNAPEAPESPEVSPGRVAIRRDGRKRPVLDASLMLASQGVRHWIEFVPEAAVHAAVGRDEGAEVAEGGDGFVFVLTVDPADAARARMLLENYDRENTGYGPDPVPSTSFSLRLSPLLHLAIPALFSFWVALVPWGAWMERRGVAAAGRILEGEWWRVLTATTLHADVEHFLGNMLSGYFIFNLLRRRAGIGTSMLLLTVAAGVANALVAAISDPARTSLGFSTVVFAGLGLLAAVETRHFPRAVRPGLRDLTPLLGAFFLAVMTGLGENSDIKAHFIGFACGVAAAPLLFWLGRRGFERAAWQTAAVLATYGVYAAAWWRAMG